MARNQFPFYKFFYVEFTKHENNSLKCSDRISLISFNSLYIVTL